MLKLSPHLSPLKLWVWGPPRKDFNFYIAVREILRISDDINLSLIYWFRGQKVVKLSHPLPPLERGIRGPPPKKINVYIAAREILRISEEMNFTLIIGFVRRKC